MLHVRAKGVGSDGGQLLLTSDILYSFSLVKKTKGREKEIEFYE